MAQDVAASIPTEPRAAAGESPALRVLGMTLGVMQTQVLRVAAELGVADLLATGPRTAAELASASGADPDALTRLMRALTHLGVVDEVAPLRFANSELGELLRADGEPSLRQYAILMAQECFAEAWPGLLQSVRTGGATFRDVHGQGLYEYFRTHPDVGAVMNQAMSDLSRLEGMAVRDAYDFRSCRLIVDVGGGRGGLLAMLLSACSGVRGILYDQPHVVAEAAAVLTGHGVADRCELIGGDFMTGVPSGGDRYLLKRILIDQTDEAASTLLENVRAAIDPDGRLLIADPDPRPRYGKGLDMFMLMAFGGKLRTEAELADLFEHTGFRLTRSFDTDSAIRLLEAAPV